MKKIIALGLATASLLTPLTAPIAQQPVAAATVKNGFYKEGNNWVYYKNNTKATGQDIVNGNINNVHGWYYIKNGVYTKYTGLAKNANGTWWVENGKVTFNKNDIIHTVYNNQDGWYNVRGSKLTPGTDSNRIYNNCNGWWYVDNLGKVNFNYTGLAKNVNGTWWLEKGKVTFKKTGWIQSSGKSYYVKESKIANQWVNINNKTYYFKNGVALKGWQQLGKGTANPDGNTAPHWSYFGNDGVLRKGLQKMGTANNPDGNSEKYLSYFGDNGWLRQNQEITVNGTRYWTSTKGWAMKYAKIGDSWYNIRPKKDGNQLLEVYMASKENWEKIQLYKNMNNLAQKFYIKNVGDDKVMIYTGTENQKKALVVTNGQKNTTINQYTANPKDGNQIWRVVENYGTGALTFINVNTKQAMSVNSVAWGNRIVTKDVNNSIEQQWTTNSTWVPQYQASVTVQNDGHANAKQLQVAENALKGISHSPYGLSYGWCAAWVSGVYQASGLGYPGGHAIEYWNKWHYSGSTSMNNIPIGAAVISNPTKGNDWYGHIGIYVGGGKVVSNLGYKCVESVQSFASRGGFTGWVWPNGRHI